MEQEKYGNNKENRGDRAFKESPEAAICKHQPSAQISFYKGAKDKAQDNWCERELETIHEIPEDSA